MIRNIKKGDGTKSGLYKITNLITNDFYIGSTNHLSSRYRSHLSTLKNKKSKCIILQNAVNKYGIENFEFSILEVCENYKEREIELLSFSLPKYNAIKENNQKREISEETRKRMSISQINCYKNGRIKTNLKGMKFNREVKASVELISNDEFLIFNSVEECANKFNCSQQAVYLNFYRKTKLKHKYKVILKH